MSSVTGLSVDLLLGVTPTRTIPVRVITTLPADEEAKLAQLLAELD